MKLVLLGLLLAMIAATAARARDEISVTTCGQYILRGQAGRLTTDLACGNEWGTCYACATAGVDTCPQLQPVVSCGGPSDCPDPAVNKCEGGGYPASVGVRLEPGARLYLDGHSISGAEIGISGSRPDGTAGLQRIRVFGPGAIFKTREAAYGENLSLSGGITLTDSLFGVAAQKAQLKDVDTSGNSIGVSIFDSLRATRLTSDDNRFAGVLSYSKARVAYSHVTGNAVIDVTTEVPPRVTKTVCDHSAALEDTGQPGIYAPTGPPWGVCSLD